MSIADGMGMKYPIDPHSDTPYVLTTDFMLSVNQNGKKVEIARTVKPSTELSKKRVAEKLELERRYYARSNLLSKSDKSLDISYEPRKPNFIYLRSPNDRDFEKCVLYAPEERYSNKDLHDIEYLLAYEELQKQKGPGKGLQEKVDLIAEIENVVNKAEKMANAVQDDTVS